MSIVQDTHPPVCVVIVKPGFLEHEEEIQNELFKSQKVTLSFPVYGKVKPGIEFWKEFYSDHKDKDYFQNLIEYMDSGEVKVFYVWHVHGWNETLKEICMDVKKRIREKYADKKVLRKNVLHCSDSYESGLREKSLYDEYLQVD